MTKEITTIIQEFEQDMKNIFKDDFCSLWLYGSYARGDYTSDSDVDIMLLVDLSPEEMDAYSDALSELGYEFNVNNDIWMMPVVKNLQHFKQWVTAYPFYTNVQKEGVILYEAA